MAVSKNI